MLQKGIEKMKNAPIVRGCLNVHAMHDEAALGLDADDDSSDVQME